MRLLLRFLGFLFAAGTVVCIVGAAAVAYFVWHYSQDLPDYAKLQDYQPPVMTRLHAANGTLIAEYARERRLFLPIQAVPDGIIKAYMAAEDKNFYKHGGLDFTGIGRAVLANIEGNQQGASTITQQVAKNFLLTNERTIDRKIKEALLAMRIEKAFSKDKILELYLNEIYLGMGAYGIAAAALYYFDKSVHELTIPEAAYLAALPKAPNNYHPFRSPARALERRNWVISRMVENGYITAAQGEEARAAPLQVVPRHRGAHIYAAEYYAEDVRRVLYERYGEKGLYEGGLSVRTALDPSMQEMARKALSKSLVNFDQQRGWRGPVTRIDWAGENWGEALAQVPALSDVAPWQLAVVLDNTTRDIKIGLQPDKDHTGSVVAERQTGIIPATGMNWARWAAGARPAGAAGAKALNVGDVVYVEAMEKTEGSYRLRQIPEISGGLVAMDPFTGRVRALVGGFSYAQSEFNRATQALRQPGSSFKPLIYAAAIDNGYTPSSIVMDAPVEISQGAGLGVWRPENYSHKFYGPQTLRFGIEKSRNVMTVRLSQDIGMPMISAYAKEFGVYDDLPPFLSMSLGAGETTLMRMATGYASFANGGKKVTPTLIDRIQDRYGKTIYRHDERECRGCQVRTGWSAELDAPELIDARKQVIDPLTAYQMTSILEGVILRGTATVLREVGRPIAGKTGTTNDYKDAWFVGYSPDLVVAIYIGYDRPRNMGRGMTGGSAAAPIARDFFKMALEGEPATPFRVPPGIKLVRVNLASGLRAGSGDGRTILEAFKPGTAPSDSFPIAASSYPTSGRGNAPVNRSPEVDHAVGRAGGLY